MSSKEGARLEEARGREKERQGNKRDREKEVQEAVNACPKVYFTDMTLPVFVATDASDYGIGAICYQVIQDKVTPVAFMSRSLTAQECNWTTTEKECFAIVYALRKFEYLIRDCKFTLLTDHQNLIYISTAKQAKK